MAGVMTNPTGRPDRDVMTRERHSPREFRIWVDGRLSEHFADGLTGVEQREEAGRTVLVGEYIDDAHLHGVLDQLRGLGIAVTRFEVVEQPARRT